jgi:hypothetical protein
MDAATQKFLLEGVILPIIVVGTIMYVILRRRMAERNAEKGPEETKKKLEKLKSRSSDKNTEDEEDEDGQEEERSYLFPCPKCSMKFTSLDLLRQHCETIHGFSLQLSDLDVIPEPASREEFGYVKAREEIADLAAVEAESRAMARLEERLGRQLAADKLITLDEHTTPSEICNTVVKTLQAVDRKKMISGSLESVIRGNDIYFRADLTLPLSQQNLQAITDFSTSIQQKQG